MLSSTDRQKAEREKSLTFSRQDHIYQYTQRGSSLLRETEESAEAKAGFHPLWEWSKGLRDEDVVLCIPCSSLQPLLPEAVCLRQTFLSGMTEKGHL